MISVPAEKERTVTAMTNEEAAVWFEARLKNIAMPGAREMHKMAVSALRAQSSSEKPNNWIRVEDRLPERTGTYLVFYHEWSDGAFLPTYEDYKIRAMRFLDSKRWCYPICMDKRCESDTHREVTHWMPLPEPPEGVLP